MNDAQLTPKQAADLLGVSKRTLQRYVKAGLVPAARISRKVVRFKKSDILALLEPVKCQNN